MLYQEPVRGGTMICPGCQSQVADGSRFCPSCGAEQGAAGAASATPDPRIGTVIEEKYRIDSRIGSGGMATVYRATRLLIGDQVALKLLHAEQLPDPQTAERFRREAQAAARLKHPNAVSIYDFGVSPDGLVYLVMELVEGQSLRRLIKEQGPLTPSAASEILTQISGALDEAHRQHIIHRDIKPDNVVVALTQGGPRVKVLDFGIARLRDLNVLSNLTQTGSVVGTPHYMSPEQCLGEELDARSDIYSLGVVVYEMLAGIVPFNSPTSMAVVVQHVNATPAPLRALNMSIPLPVEAVVLKALEKRRDARPATAGEFAARFAAAVRGELATEASPQTAAAPSGGGAAFPATVRMPTPVAIPAVAQPARDRRARGGGGVSGQRARRVTLPMAAAAVLVAAGVVAAAIWWPGQAANASHAATLLTDSSSAPSPGAAKPGAPASGAAEPVSRPAPAPAPDADASYQAISSRIADARPGDLPSIQADLLELETEHALDYRFPYEHAGLVILGVEGHPEAFSRLFNAAERALKTGKEDEMLSRMSTDGRGRLHRLVDHAEWESVTEALEHHDASLLRTGSHHGH